MSGEKRDLVVTRVVGAKVKEAWAAWTEAEKVMEWWGPDGFTSPVAKMDVREGGTSLVCMRAPKEMGGRDMYNVWAYTKIVPMHELEFVTNLADETGRVLDPAMLGLPADFPRDLRMRVTFKAMGCDETEMTVTQFGWTAGQMMGFAEMGLRQSVEKMAKAVGNRR